jgi:hypothetical protein
MKKILIGLLVMIFTGLSAQQAQIELLGRQSIELDFVDYRFYALKLKNSSSAEIEVSIISRVSNEQVRGFGLAPKSTVEEVLIESDSYALFTNLSEDEALFSIEASPKVAAQVAESDGVSFILRNNTFQSIPLVIPSVMNPNLSPKSNSGVYLKYGQKVYLRRGVSKKLILTVDETIREGALIDVDSIIRLVEDEKI